MPPPEHPLAHDATQTILEAIARSGRTFRELSAQLGCSHATLLQKIQRQSWTLRSLAQLERVLDGHFTLVFLPGPRQQDDPCEIPVTASIECRARQRA
jgi:hypothetical protein